METFINGLQNAQLSKQDTQFKNGLWAGLYI